MPASQASYGASSFSKDAAPRPESKIRVAVADLFQSKICCSPRFVVPRYVTDEEGLYKIMIFRWKMGCDDDMILG